MNKLALMSRDKQTGANGAPGRVDDTPHYQAFLSYSHHDSAQADWLHQAIERFAVPKGLVGRVTVNGTVPKSLTPIFRDRHELAASSDLGQTIRLALKQSRFLIVLCSPAAATSRWVNEEIIAFKKLHGERCVLAAIIAGEPWASEIAGREAEECFPPALREKIDRKGQSTGKRAEPIAADLREERDGREAGKLKLVAGMLGLGLDDLVRREQQRRQKRLTYLAAASLAGMALTSGLAVFAFDKRDEARDQRREAEGLVEFMLGDLRDELEPIGKLEALDAVGSRALAYFSKQDMNDLSDAALAQRSRALGLMGSIANSRRDLTGAGARYREAMVGTAEMIRRRPDDPQRLFDHAQNVFYLGQVETNLGRTKAAEEHIRDYKRLADRMVAIEPGNRKWQTEVGYADTNLGLTLYAQHRYAEASQQFARGLQTVEALAASDPGSDRVSVAEALAWLADALYNNNKLNEAIAQRERQMKILDPLIAQGRDVNHRQRAIPALRALGRMLASTGAVEEGMRHSRRAVEIAEALMPTEPGNMNWVELGALARLDLGSILLAAGKSSEAAVEIRAGCELGDRLGSRSTTTPDRRELAFNCLARRVDLALAAGSTTEATGLARQAIPVAQQVKGADDARNRYLLALAYKALADALTASGDRPAAVAASHTALRVWPTAAWGPKQMQVKAILLQNVGRTAEAREIEQRLATIGYKRLL
ncbi:MAG: toll/interleukin-1 receptor domain-containing protein [Sphingomicrobium sp.]